MFCEKCGSELLEEEYLDLFSKWGQSQFDRRTGEKFTEVSVYLRCPKDKWYNEGHDRLYVGSKKYYKYKI